MTFRTHMLAQFVCDDLVVGFSVAVSELSVASPRCSLLSSGSLVTPGFHPFYWSACNQDCLRGFDEVPLLVLVGPSQ